MSDSKDDAPIVITEKMRRLVLYALQNLSTHNIVWCSKCLECPDLQPKAAVDRVTIQFGGCSVRGDFCELHIGHFKHITASPCVPHETIICGQRAWVSRSDLPQKPDMQTVDLVDRELSALAPKRGE